MTMDMAKRFAQTLVQSNKEEEEPFVVQLDDQEDLDRVASELDALGFRTVKNPIRFLLEVTPPSEK